MTLSSTSAAVAIAPSSSDPDRAQPIHPETCVAPRTIRVLHIINDLSIGGAEMMLYRLLCQENGEHFHHSVISLMDRGSLRERIRELGIKVTSPGMLPAIPSPQSIWRLQKIVRELKPDIMHGWLYHGSLAAQLASMLSRPRIPAIWSIHYSMSSFDFEKKMTAAVMRLCRRLSSKADAIVFVSHVSESQHRELGYSSGNLVIPNGIDTNLFIPSAESRSSVRSELCLSSDSLLIGLINRYHSMKDHPSFLRAASMILAKNKKAHFLLVGREVEQTNPELMTLIAELGLKDHTHLLGERADISRLIAGLDILTLSSLYGESFPITVGEAMACGVPCVVTDVGDSSWLVADTGRTVSPGQPEALAGAWQELIDIGSDGRSSLGRAARQRVIDHFSLPSIAAQYKRLYLNIVESLKPANQALT